MKRLISGLLVLACLVQGGSVMALEQTSPSVPVETTQPVVEPTLPESPATVAPVAWYDASLAFCQERGLVGKDEGAALQPEALLSKIALIAMLSQGFGLHDGGGQPLYLTAQGHFDAMAAKGLLTAEEFPAGDWYKPVGRFEAALLCHRLLVVEGYAHDGDTYIDNAGDKGIIPQAYRDTVNTVYAAGVMAGTDDALTFSGWSGLTLAQGWTIVHRLLDAGARRPAVLPAAYAKCFSVFTTGYGEHNGAGVAARQENRAFNIRKAAASLDGTVVGPGEIFSFNDTVGNPSKANGYLMVAGLYGSGICQNATTLFNAALQANMTITARHNHSIKSTYVPAGTDSTIYYPGYDLKFQNPYPCPVRIVFDINPVEETMTVKIYGTAETYLPTVTWSVAETRGLYTLTRYADGAANYTCTSWYRG